MLGMSEEIKKSTRDLLKTAGIAFLLLAFYSGLSSCGGAVTADHKPNFVIIFVDDLGYGDIGPFGSRLNRTPHLDRMADEGMRLTSFYAMPLCTPARAALMTGCYPKRLGLEGRPSSCFIVLLPGDSNGLNLSEITIAETLRFQGYTTGCIGKWHLGDQPEYLPTRHGFDYYYGLPYSNDMTPEIFTDTWAFAPLPLMRNESILGSLKLEEQANLTKNYTTEAVNFIEKNRERPFFLYLSHTMVHYPYAASEKFRGRSANGLFGDAVEEIDWSTGEILNALDRFGLSEKTLVFFLSDNGAAGGTSGPLRGRKGQTWEGGIRVPCIARWPGRITAGSTCDEVASLMDFHPTLAGLSGAELPTDCILDGHDIWPLLKGKPGARSPYEVFYYYQQSKLEAVRSGRWKLVLPRKIRVRKQTKGEGQSQPEWEFVDLPLSLFDLDKDIGETTNLAAQNPDVVKELLKHVEKARNDLGDGKEHPGKNCRLPGRVENPRLLIPHDNPEYAARYYQKFAEECRKNRK